MIIFCSYFFMFGCYTVYDVNVSLFWLLTKLKVKPFFSRFLFLFLNFFVMCVFESIALQVWCTIVQNAWPTITSEMLQTSRNKQFNLIKKKKSFQKICSEFTASFNESFAFRSIERSQSSTYKLYNILWICLYGLY